MSQLERLQKKLDFHLEKAARLQERIDRIQGKTPTHIGLGSDTEDQT